jgi:hypothetical protein
VPGYTEVRRLGGGGFGEVVLATQDASGTPVAIKYLHPGLLRDPEHAAAFRAEARTLKGLDSPHVVRLYEYVEGPAGAAIVMELVDGVTLAKILENQGKTTPEAALVVLYGSLLGLAAAHGRGVVHRDYKPANVLIDGQGASKLTDFGIAALAGDRPPAAGTLRYRPPEQFEGAPASPAGDVYAATVTFYQCLTGRLPFGGQTSQELYEQHKSAPVPIELVPEPLRPVIARGLAKSLQQRPRDAAQLTAELRTAAVGEYGPDWEERGRSHLGEAALLLALLWPSGGSSSVTGSAVEQVHLHAPARAAHQAQPAHPGQPAHGAQAGQATGSNGQAGEAHAEHLHHVEHVEHLERVEHLEHLEHVAHEEHLAHARHLNRGNGDDRRDTEHAHPGESQPSQPASSSPAAAASSAAVDALANWSQSLVGVVSRSSRTPHWLRRALPRDPSPRTALAMVTGAIATVIVLFIVIAVAAGGSNAPSPGGGIAVAASATAGAEGGSAGHCVSDDSGTGLEGTADPGSAASVAESLREQVAACRGGDDYQFSLSEVSVTCGDRVSQDEVTTNGQEIPAYVYQCTVNATGTVASNFSSMPWYVEVTIQLSNGQWYQEAGE